MKTLKPGRDQKGWATQFTCTGKGNKDGGCGAELLVEQDDLFKSQHTDYGNDTTHYLSFNCHCCGVMTDIPQTKWPSHAIQETLPSWKEYKEGKRSSDPPPENI